MIDYINIGIKHNNKYNHVDKSLEDLKVVYPCLTYDMRKAVVGFIKDRLINEVPEDCEMQCHELIYWCNTQEEDLIKQDKNEQKLIESLGIQKYNRGEIYKQLALFLEGHCFIDAALKFMIKANLYFPFPDNKNIQKKVDQYKKIIDFDNK